MGVLGDKLAAAIQEQKEQELAAKNNVNNFVWKGPKREIAGMRVQSEVKLEKHYCKPLIITLLFFPQVPEESK